MLLATSWNQLPYACPFNWYDNYQRSKINVGYLQSLSQVRCLAAQSGTGIFEKLFKCYFICPMHTLPGAILSPTILPSWHTINMTLMMIWSQGIVYTRLKSVHRASEYPPSCTTHISGLVSQNLIYSETSNNGLSERRKPLYSGQIPCPRLLFP